ncbi:uncharacterized protein LOC100210255 isoform X1 [Hydra vulgaris]|uniref:uncharacterized protein LOC100210255 isoform X1 n=1 Tax=Hydra vulgaris TaxID=6087 RepID=UPI001F5F2782|nr:protein NO VEIN-like [Hydra vulgaris]
MSSVEELRVRLLYFIKKNGVSIQFGKLSNDYIERWKEPFNTSYHKINKIKKMLRLKKCAKKILGREAQIYKDTVYLKGFSPIQPVNPIKSNNTDFNVITDEDYISLESSVGSQNSQDMHNSSESFLKTMLDTSSKCAEKNLKKSLANMGNSKDTAIPIDEEDEDEAANDKKNDVVAENACLYDSDNIADSFEQYRSFQLVHVAYCKLRIVAMMYSLKKNVLFVHQFKLWFKEMYRENFFCKNVLRYYISETESHFQYPELFLQRFCSDFILLSEDNITCNVLMTLTSDIKPLYLKLLDELIQLLEKLELPDNVLKENLIPSEIKLLQYSDDQPVDVLRIPDRFGNHHKMYFFPNSNTNNKIKERPTLNEINEKVTQIQNKICRRGDAVRIIDIIKELCLFYNVSCIKDLCPLDSRPLRQDGDIPAIFNIMKLQGKINAFIQSFVNFRNICTLYELNQEICKLDSKASFVDYKLGPLQKQILIYEYFQFPPNKQDIPQITTCDIFNLIWKLENERYHNEKKKGNKGVLESNNSNSRFSLTEFMDYFIKQHGFAEPYESGVRITSISLAVFVVKKAKLGDFHHEREMVKKFNNQLREELNLYLSNRLNEIVGAQTPGKPQNLIEKVCGMKLLDAFNQIYLMLQHMKQEAYKKLPSTANLINFSDTVMNALLIIQKNPLMSSIFHIILSTAPLKVLGMDDVTILNYLGFEETIKQMVENHKPKEMPNNYSNIASVPKELVLQTTKKWFSQNNELTLDLLSRIEKQIISAIDEKLHCFDDLGHGSFLKFLIENESLKELVEYGLKTVSQNRSESVSKDDLGIFIHQCGDQGCKDDISIAAKVQFNLKDLSFMRNFAVPTNTLFQYQHAVLCGTEYQKELNSLTDSDNILSMLAVSKINALPYLEDVSKLMNWDEIFQRKLGSLKEFVKSKFNSKDVCYFFLELQFGKFVKVLKDCSIESFTEAFVARDAKLVSICLTSIICSNRRLEHAPLALLSNVIQKNMLTSSETSEFSEKHFLVFILECFQLIPFDLLCCIIHKMFLTPLSTIYGNLNVPSVLLKVCSDCCRSRLHALGFQLSIVEWIENYKDEFSVLKAEENEKEAIEKTKFQVIGENKNIEKKHDESISTLVNEKEELIMESSTFPEQGKVKEFFGSSSDQNNHCREVINNIRRDQFGVGIEFGEQEMKLIEVHREREGRSLQHLSNELYSKDSHFVLELIQNADDNQYPETFFEKNEKPAVAFIVEHDKITILNNEKGFSERDIKALCDVGKSTKGIHCKGYIGQKGIGFKSVFRVTNSPEIHSNGYHIKFDASHGSNGYILPYWIDCWESKSKLLYQPSKKQNYTWITQIVLPLKRDMQHTKLTSRFHDIHPSLLLFLNRLHTIIIDDKVSNVLKVIERENLDENIVRLSNNNDSALWFVVGKELNVDIRQDVKSTNLAVAFPLNNLNDEVLPNQPVYAYLPLRSYGFKFIIQADFEVPSSREDINKDSAWNQCILQHIPKLVVEAFHCFKKHHHFTGLDGVIKYLKFMDLEDHVLGVFKQVSHQIIKSLQREACLPAMSKDCNAYPQMPITWVVPSCIINPQENVLKVISQEMLQEKLGLYYLNKDVNTVISKRMLISLGVNEMTLELLLEICRLIVHQFNSLPQNKQDCKAFYQWIGQWLHTVYLRLQDQCDCSEKTFNILRSLYIYPMSDRSLKSLNGHVVFFPVSDNNKIIFNKKSVQPIHLIEQDLLILSHDFMSYLSGIEQQQLKNFLCDLGVKEITPLDIVQNCIIPTFKSGKWKEKSENLVVAYVNYLHEQYMLDSQIFDILEIRQCLMLLTNKGFQSPFDSTNPIYFGREYNNDIDLQDSFPSADWTLISSCYLSCLSDIEKVSLKRFLSSLSVHTFMVVRKITKTLHVSDLIASCWEKYFETWPQTIDDTYIIDDLECPEFNQVVDGKNYREIYDMLEEFDERWSSEFSKFNFIRPGCLVKNTSGEVVSSTFCSFLLKMRSSAWLANNEDENSLHCPRDLFLRNDRLFSLLGNKVNYLTNRVKSKNFILTLGVQTEVNFKRFANEFMKWREQTVFTTNYAHTQTIYQYFEKQNAVYNEIINELKKGPFIFLPSNHCNQIFVESSVVEGKFYSITKLCWEDPSDILNCTKDDADHRRILKGYYPEHMQNYFLYTLRVSRYPSVCEYVKLASTIASQTILPDRDGCAKLFTIFSVLGQLMISDNKLEELKDLNFPESMEERRKQYEDLTAFIDPILSMHMQQTDLFGEKIFPTSKNSFSCLSDMPLLVDNKDFAHIFQECEKVPLIFFDFILNMIKPNNSFRSKRAFEAFDFKMIKIMVFFKACGVSLLSKVYIEPEVITENMKRGCATWERIIHEISPIVQRFLNVKYPVFYNNLTAKSYHDYLQNSTLFSVDTLETVYRLFDRSDVIVSRKKVACVSDAAGKRALIYITSQYASEKNMFEQILNEVLNLYVSQNEEIKEELFDFIQMYNAVSNKTDYLKRKNIAELSSSDIRWTYPLSIIYSENPIVSKPVQNIPPMQSSAVESSGLKCWPPRNPVTTGSILNTEFSKYTENEVNEKWKPPESPVAKESSFTKDLDISTNDNQELNRKRKLSSSELVDINDEPQLSKKICAGLPHHSSQHDLSVPIVKDGLVIDNESLANRWKMAKVDYVPSAACQNVKFTNQIDFAHFEKLILEEQYDDLPIILSDSYEKDFKDLSLDQNETESKQMVGKLGENLVYRHLCEIYKDDILSGRAKITWLNEVEETGQPYDLKIDFTSLEQKCIFIEVKTSYLDGKKEFEISPNQLRFAFEKQSAFHLYRVTGINANLRIRRLVNLSMYMDSKSVRLFMLI